jgi:hypothetical protein
MIARAPMRFRDPVMDRRSPGAAPQAIRVRWSAVALLGIVLLFSRPADAFGGADPLGDNIRNVPAPPAAGQIVWHTDHFFTDCNGNCAVSLFAGRQVQTTLPNIILNNPSLPWDWQWGSSQLVGAAISRRLLTLWHALNIEPEFGLAKRFGGMHSDEAWLALYFRWTQFPWNPYLRTSLAVSLGVSAAVDLPQGSHDASIYNYFSPEATFALPRYPQYQLLLQLHHRSNLGIWNATDPGWQYLTVGIRYRF